MYTVRHRLMDLHQHTKDILNDAPILSDMFDSERVAISAINSLQKESAKLLYYVEQGTFSLDEEFTPDMGESME